MTIKLGTYAPVAKTSIYNSEVSRF